MILFLKNNITFANSNLSILKQHQMKTEQNSNNLNKLTTMKSKILLALFALFSLTTMAQTPVRFSVQQKKVSPTEVDVIFTGKIDAGWHVYSTGTTTLADQHQQHSPQKKLKAHSQWVS